MSELTVKDAASIMHLANAVFPSLIILTRKHGNEANVPTPIYSYMEASELLAKWADTAPSTNEWVSGHRVEVELFFGPVVGKRGEEVINLVVTLQREYRLSGYDLRLHLKRFAAHLASVAEGTGA